MKNKLYEFYQSKCFLCKYKQLDYISSRKRILRCDFANQFDDIFHNVECRSVFRYCFNRQVDCPGFKKSSENMCGFCKFLLERYPNLTPTIDIIKL